MDSGQFFNTLQQRFNTWLRSNQLKSYYFKDSEWVLISSWFICRHLQLFYIFMVETDYPISVKCATVKPLSRKSNRFF